MHHIHVILSNEENAEACLQWVAGCLDDKMLLSNGVDYGTVEGCINLATGEYTRDKYYKGKDEITTIEELERYANMLFSDKLYNLYIEELKQAIDTQDWWLARKMSKYLDGMKYAVKDGKKWTAKDTFCINDGELDMNGITDWTGCYYEMDETSPAPTEYAVIVDFRS